MPSREFASFNIGRPIIQELHANDRPQSPPLHHPLKPEPIEMILIQETPHTRQGREFIAEVQHRIDVAPVMPAEVFLFDSDMDDFKAGVGLVNVSKESESIDHYFEVDQAGKAEVTLYQGIESNLLFIQRKRESIGNGQKAVFEQWYGQRTPSHPKTVELKEKSKHLKGDPFV